MTSGIPCTPVELRHLATTIAAGGTETWGKSASLGPVEEYTSEALYIVGTIPSSPCSRYRKNIISVG
jgi:hypothetical protein